MLNVTSLIPEQFRQMFFLIILKLFAGNLQKDQNLTKCSPHQKSILFPQSNSSVSESGEFVRNSASFLSSFIPLARMSFTE